MLDIGPGAKSPGVCGSTASSASPRAGSEEVKLGK